MVTLIILGIFAMMSLINSNYRVLIVLLSMVIGGAVTISYLAFNYDTLQLPTLYWLFIQSLSLYIVYLSFQTLFFERFIACFKIKGNVGFSSHPSTLSDTQERFVCFFSKNIAARISTGCNSTTNFRDG